jgi:hypothetical protein
MNKYFTLIFLLTAVSSTYIELLLKNYTLGINKTIQGNKGTITIINLNNFGPYTDDLVIYFDLLISGKTDSWSNQTTTGAKVSA